MADPMIFPSGKTSRQLLLERRTAVRYPTALEALCRTGGGRTGVTWPASVQDISAKGVGLVIGRKFSAGTLLTVLFQEPGGATVLTVQARVVYALAGRRGLVHGCQFIRRLTQQELDALVR